MTDTFKCPNCEAEFERTGHYRATVRTQNMIFLLSGTPKIIVDLCGKCNYMVEQED